MAVPPNKQSTIAPSKEAKILPVVIPTLPLWRIPLTFMGVAFKPASSAPKTPSDSNSARSISSGANESKSARSTVPLARPDSASPISFASLSASASGMSSPISSERSLSSNERNLSTILNRYLLELTKIFTTITNGSHFDAKQHDPTNPEKNAAMQRLESPDLAKIVAIKYQITKNLLDALSQGGIKLFIETLNSEDSRFCRVCDRNNLLGRDDTLMSWKSGLVWDEAKKEQQAQLTLVFEASPETTTQGYPADCWKKHLPEIAAIIEKFQKQQSASSSRSATPKVPASSPREAETEMQTLKGPVGV